MSGRPCAPAFYQDSYYQCLAKRFKDYNFSLLQTEARFNGSNCVFRKICTPFSLPSTSSNCNWVFRKMSELFGGEDIPICQTETEKACFEQVISDLESNQDHHCKRSCHIMEFKTRLDKKRQTIIYRNEISLGYHFELPLSTRNMRSKKPFKTVHREHLVKSMVSLLADVGGTLGIFVGLSLFGTSEWFMKVLEGFLAKRNKIKKADSNKTMT